MGSTLKRKNNRMTGIIPKILIACLLLALSYCAAPGKAGPAQQPKVNPSPGADSREKWELFCIFGEELFPSYIVAVSMLNSAEKYDTKDGEQILGAPYGVIGVRVKAPSDNARVRIELEGTKLIRKTVYEEVLKKGGEEYEIYPFVKYDYDGLLSVHQAVPEDLTVSLSLNGGSPGEKTMTLRVRTINDCVFEVENGDQSEDLSWIFSAYVNENDPFVDSILKEALKSGDVSSFGGYLGDREDVLAEIEALWNAVQKSGIKYSDASTPIAESDYVSSQHVRLLGESVRSGQANCVDGTVLFASLFRKIGLKTYLMLASDHAFLGVDLTEDGKNRAYIETTIVDDGSLEDALDEGSNEEKDYKAKKDLLVVDVNQWRDRGILPLKDSNAVK